MVKQVCAAEREARGRAARRTLVKSVGAMMAIAKECRWPGTEYGSVDYCNDRLYEMQKEIIEGIRSPWLRKCDEGRISISGMHSYLS
jgi:hypothetical protein